MLRQNRSWCLGGARAAWQSGGVIVDLIPFPATQSPATAVSVEVERDGDWLRLVYRVEGDPAAMAWPPPDRGRADRLWKHTCFEAFAATDDGYREFNLATSGQWASYRFDRYRQGMRAADQQARVLDVTKAAERTEIDARIELPRGARRLGLSAVIEAVDGTFSYWALAHPSDKPDFHHPDSFVLELP